MALLAETNPFLEARLRYQDNAELFVRQCFKFPNASELSEGKDIYPWQREVLAAYSRGEPWMAIRSGHGVGKTTLLVWIAWHRMLCRFPQKTAMTAPSEKQVFDAFWAEFEAWGNRLDPMLRLQVETTLGRAVVKERPHESFISVKTARAENPDALQGLHSEWELVIVDEASGVPQNVWEAAGSSLTGPHPTAILTGNPVSGQGFFHDAYSKPALGWWVRHVSRGELFDLDTDLYALKEERESGGRHTNRYRIRVLGEPPVAEDDVIIPFDLVEPALSRDVQVPKQAPVVWGLDCARFGGNKSALAKRQTVQLLEPVRSWSKRDTYELAAAVKVDWDTTPDFLKPIVICVDDIGVGGGVVDGLRAAGLPARGINVSEQAALSNQDRYANLRMELWMKAKEWFARRDCKLPDYYKRPREGDDFLGQLTKETYDFMPRSGKMYVNTPKNQAHSPDLADAFVLTFAADAVALARSRDRINTNWRPRKLKGLV